MLTFAPIPESTLFFGSQWLDSAKLQIDHTHAQVSHVYDICGSPWYQVFLPDHGSMAPSSGHVSQPARKAAADSAKPRRRFRCCRYRPRRRRTTHAYSQLQGMVYPPPPLPSLTLPPSAGRVEVA